eukprot:TRINITY_DN8157_c0_g1_i1.p2 TRINITY_DN8157_c0_g1~~TRINITY_DN8157_c0_g1_i1.p2  ORF type:complete len:85 (+),score=3.21 TRINITY_DN8157_c0_g1_i1:126-380(+)
MRHRGKFGSYQQSLGIDRNTVYLEPFSNLAHATGIQWLIFQFAAPRIPDTSMVLHDTDLVGPDEPQEKKHLMDVTEAPRRRPIV